VPGKSGLPVNSSARIQPTDQTSTAINNTSSSPPSPPTPSSSSPSSSAAAAALLLVVGVSGLVVRVTSRLQFEYHCGPFASNLELRSTQPPTLSGTENEQ